MEVDDDVRSTLIDFFPEEIEALSKQDIFDKLLEFQYLDVLKLCKKYPFIEDICVNDKFWQRKFQRDFPSLNIAVYEGETWLMKYDHLFDLAIMTLARAVKAGDQETIQKLVDFGVPILDHDIDTYSCSPGILGAGTTTPLGTGLFTGGGALLGGTVAGAPGAFAGGALGGLASDKPLPAAVGGGLGGGLGYTVGGPLGAGLGGGLGGGLASGF